jgi:hypothetical protein
MVLNMARHNKDKGKIEGPFVPMLVDTMASPAWRAMSCYARVLYIALKSRYSFKTRNNGRIYLSVRVAGEETGLNKNQIARGFRELNYYGFIVLTEFGCLGVNGKGKAPHWRLTELGYMLDPPTRDFMRWGGEVFHEQKPPEYYKRQEQRLNQLAAAKKAKKQNPVPTSGTPCPDGRDITASRQPGHLPKKLSRRSGHTDDAACPDVRDISRINHLAAPTAVFQAPAIRPDSRAVAAYLAAWAVQTWKIN